MTSDQMPRPPRLPRPSHSNWKPAELVLCDALKCQAQFTEVFGMLSLCDVFLARDRDDSIWIAESTWPRSASDILAQAPCFRFRKFWDLAYQKSEPSRAKLSEAERRTESCTESCTTCGGFCQVKRRQQLKDKLLCLDDLHLVEAGRTLFTPSTV